MFFEGSEKKIELVVKSSARGLRSYGRKAWEEVVAKSRASILSDISNEQMDAYLLSESSLFVSDRRALMITCGTTTLVHAVIAMLKFIPKEDVELLIYERKREIFPEYQRSNFYQDVKLLREHVDGTAYRFGDEDDHHIYLFQMENNFQASEKDRTLEILMHGLDRSAAQVFESGNAHNEQSVLKSGVRELLKDYQVDDFIFEPQGYSLNAIKEDQYYTIHVTPQSFGSYVSFETNHSDQDELKSLVERVLEVFKPSSCDILYFEKQGLDNKIPCAFQKKRSYGAEIAGYRVDFDHYYKVSDTIKPAEILEID
ncbi:MAG: adenosylmethionine decarboxylase [Bdellovibrionota bacterium]|nr:adenosylmethionine decarboxylase [Bdellovibrionota bacterium]